MVMGYMLKDVHGKLIDWNHVQQSRVGTLKAVLFVNVAQGTQVAQEDMRALTALNKGTTVTNGNPYEIP